MQPSPRQRDTNGRLLFYIKHAGRSLQREKRRSSFAAFAIAAGVAAIIGLQSLSLSIEDSVTRDIQATHQADIVVSSDDGPFSPQARAHLDDLASQARFVEWTYFYVANPDRPSFIASSKRLESRPLKWLQPYLVEPEKYPLYGEVRCFQRNDYQAQAATFGEDPYPLGIKAMGRTVERAIQGSLEQDLITKPVQLGDIYHTTTLDT